MSKIERNRTAFFSGMLCFVFTGLTAFILFLSIKGFNEIDAAIGEGTINDAYKTAIMGTICITVYLVAMAVSSMFGIGFGLRYIWKNTGLHTIFTKIFVLGHIGAIGFVLYKFYELYFPVISSL